MVDAAAICIAVGCTNPVVRVFVHQVSPTVRFGVCAFHGVTIIKHGTDEQVRRYVFPFPEGGDDA